LRNVSWWFPIPRQCFGQRLHYPYGPSRPLELILTEQTTISCAGGTRREDRPLLDPSDVIRTVCRFRHFGSILHADDQGHGSREVCVSICRRRSRPSRRIAYCSADAGAAHVSMAGDMSLGHDDAANTTPTFGSTLIIPRKWMSHAGTHACSHVMLRMRASVRQVNRRRSTEHRI
jgi:hypothetical protein